MLDLSSLEKSIAQLEDALKYCASDIAKKDEQLAYHLRAGAIQAFEFTYELSYKMLKRYIEVSEQNPNIIEEMTFNDIIRKGYEINLLKADINAWRSFRKDRGTTSHTYDEDKAKDVFDSIPAFLEEAKFLLESIQNRQKHLL